MSALLLNSHTSDAQIEVYQVISINEAASFLLIFIINFDLI